MGKGRWWKNEEQRFSFVFELTDAEVSNPQASGIGIGSLLLSKRICGKVTFDDAVSHTTV